MQDPALIVERNMRQDEEDKLLTRAVNDNPALGAAEVSDIIDIYHSWPRSTITDQLWSKLEGEGPTNEAERELYAMAMTAIAVIYGEKALEYEPVAIRGILHRLTKKEEDDGT